MALCRLSVILVLLGVTQIGPGLTLAAEPESPAVLPGTKPLQMSGDIASELVAGVDRFLVKEIDKSIQRRAQFYKHDISSREKYNESIEPNRRRLAHILGVRDARVAFDSPQLVNTVTQSALVGRGDGFDVLAVRWPAFGDVYGEGLLLVPTGARKVADVVAIPDADQTPEMIVGLVEGVAPESQFARRLAESGCRVLVPALVDRAIEPVGQIVAKLHGTPQPRAGAHLTHREFLYRSAFELGRHLIGYEVQKVLAGVDWFAQGAGDADARIGVIGWGEGGLLALYAGALDTRIDATCVSGHFDSRQNVWAEPLDRNVFGLLEQFGDAELAAMIAPRALVVEAARGPEAAVVNDVMEKDPSADAHAPVLEAMKRPGITVLRTHGGGPGRLVTPKLEDVRAEVDRANRLVEGLEAAAPVQLIASGAGTGPFGSQAALKALLASLSSTARLADLGKAPQHLGKTFDPDKRLLRQMREIDRHNRWLLSESHHVRDQFMAKLDTKSLDKYRETVEWYRDFFYDEVIGRVEYDLSAPNVRTRLVEAYDKPAWTGYDVVMDVFPNVIAYGVLVVPKNIKPGERRPVVVCQHGLEGRPQDIITGDHPAYHDFAGVLAERGFVTFAPQNLYLFADRFRTLQRKANPLKKTLFSIIVPQHQQIVDWLQTLPYVDGQRIAFYGLSYGGKSAMRIPPLVTDYSLSICSADFDEWVWKIAATDTRGRYSYIWTGEYEIFEFDLGSTFNYSEMSALICPRPFMVERGHFDGVAPDEAVGYEYAKIRHRYAALLDYADRTEIEWFVGPHTIHGQGTYDFLHKHLDWPKPDAAK
jgi:dienelactone hydrolase